MKKFLIVMGAVFCGLIVLLVIGMILVAVRGTKLDKESRAYADATIAAIVTTWNEDAFFERASPELKRLMSANDGDRLFLRLRELGHLKRCDSAQGQSMTSAVLGQPRRTTARYEAAAEFEKAEAKIVVELIKHATAGKCLPFRSIHRSSFRIEDNAQSIRSLGYHKFGCALIRPAFGIPSAMIVRQETKTKGIQS